MSYRPLFSVVIPAFNRASALPMAIQSLLGQTYSNWEALVIDDGSSDNTQAVVEGYGDPRIRYVYQNHAGLPAARNNGMLRATGDWIVYLDSDNELLPNYLDCMLSAVQAQPCLYAVPQAQRIYELYENGQKVKAFNDAKPIPQHMNVKDVATRRAMFDCNGFMHVASLVQRYRWDSSFFMFEDWDFFMQIANDNPNTFLYVPQVLLKYYQRYGGDGMCSSMSYERWAEAFEMMYRKHQFDSLLKGQHWYPERVIHYKQLAQEYRAGKFPSPQQRFFVR